MSTFRLATINVHSFTKPSKREDNLDDLVSILQPLNLDLIALQEIQNNHKWKKFCHLLSLSNFIYGPTVGEHFGNGIASRYSIQSHTNHISKYLCQGGTRSILQCSLDTDQAFLKDKIFAVTHLDPFNEDDRLIQINQFNLDKQNIDVIMGDMNALTREDYSDDYFKEFINDKREKSRWEKPRFDLTNLLTHQWKYQDAFKLINPTLKDQQIATCSYGTRIDYIYLHPRTNDQWIITECSIIDTKGATDHSAVLMEIKIKSESINYF